MAGYIGSKASVVTPGAERKKVFAITSTTTSMTGLSYSPGFVHVFHNGVRLVDGTDYTATNGTSITLTNAALNGDEVVVISYATYQNVDSYTKAEADGRYVNVTGDTMTGNLVVPMAVTQSALSNRNKIINGNFDVWQRGTSFTTNSYGADRWVNAIGGSSATQSRQPFTLGQTDVPNNPTYFCRTAVTSSAGAGNYSILTHKVEGVRTFAGQTATLSFWAKADASKDIAVEFSQYFGAGGSPSSTILGIDVTTCSLTTSWQKFNVTVDVPSISGKTLGTNNADCFQIIFWLDAGSDYNARTNSLGQQSGTFDIAQVQLEAGDTATPFEHRSYGQELALCQRYYTKLGGDNIADIYGAAYITSSGFILDTLTLPVKMRTSPTGTKVGTWTVTNVLQPQIVHLSTTTFVLFASGTVIGQAVYYNPASTGYLTFDAEL